MNKSRFESIGVYLPEKVVTTSELISKMGNKALFNVERLTGIKSRRWRSETEDSYILATKAVKQCLEKSRYKASDVDIIINSSISHSKGVGKYMLEPPLSKLIKAELGFRPSAINFDITNACAGMLTGIKILDNMIRSGMVKNGIVVSGECITPISETAVREIKAPIDAQLASLTVGDAGSAIMMDRSLIEDEGIHFAELMTIAQFADLCIGQPSNQTPGVAMYTDSTGIHQESIQRLPFFLEYFFKKNNIPHGDFDYFIPHQTSIRAIMLGLKLIGHVIGDATTLISVDRFGNTSSTSHFVVLHDHLSQKKLKKNSTVLFTAVASGIVMGCVFATIGGLEACYGYDN
jgi:3-oxoacyl-[acyl-carrier-protein] synthase III